MVGSNDTSIIPIGQKGDLISVILAFRTIPKSENTEKYGPQKISIFSNLFLGISEKQLLESATYFQPKKEDEEAIGSVFYGANVTFAMFPAEVVFIFFEGSLDRITVIIPGVSDQEEELGKQYNSLNVFFG